MPKRAQRAIAERSLLQKGYAAGYGVPVSSTPEQVGTAMLAQVRHLERPRG